MPDAPHFCWHVEPNCSVGCIYCEAQKLVIVDGFKLDCGPIERQVHEILDCTQSFLVTEEETVVDVSTYENLGLLCVEYVSALELLSPLVLPC